MRRLSGELSETTRVTVLTTEDQVEVYAIAIEFGRGVLHGRTARSEPVFGLPAISEPEQALDLEAAQGAVEITGKSDSFDGGTFQVSALNGTEMGGDVIGDGDG